MILRDELAEQSLLERVIITAEKYSDRVDAAAVLEILPQNTPIAYLQRYLKLVLEHASSKKRNLQVRNFTLLSWFDSHQIHQFSDNTSTSTYSRSEFTDKRKCNT